MAYYPKYGTQRMISGGGNFSNYSSAGPLAKTMAAKSTPMARAGELNPNLVTPSTLGTPVTQPTRNPFSPPPVAPPYVSDVRTQTGNGGGASNIPGPSQGGPTQTGGPGAAPLPPGMDPANWGPPPQAPGGGPQQQFDFANSVASQMKSATGQQFLNNLGKYGQAGVTKFLSEPQSASVADFNRIAQTNPVMAEQMQAAGGQQFRDAIMAANNWTNAQNNSFINQYGSGALPGFGPNPGFGTHPLTGPAPVGAPPVIPPALTPR